MFTVLPFSFTTACYIFTKVLIPLVTFWHAKDMKVVMYLNDGIGAAEGRASAKAASNFIRSTLGQAGFVVHPEKCKWEPSPSARWLGFNLDLSTGCLSVPPEKISHLKERLASAATSNCIQARAVSLHNRDPNFSDAGHWACYLFYDKGNVCTARD